MASIRVAFNTSHSCGDPSTWTSRRSGGASTFTSFSHSACRRFDYLMVKQSVFSLASYFDTYFSLYKNRKLLDHSTSSQFRWKSLHGGRLRHTGDRLSGCHSWLTAGTETMRWCVSCWVFVFVSSCSPVDVVFSD